MNFFVRSITVFYYKSKSSNKFMEKSFKTLNMCVDASVCSLKTKICYIDIIV